MMGKKKRGEKKGDYQLLMLYTLYSFVLPALIRPKEKRRKKRE